RRPTCSLVLPSLPLSLASLPPRLSCCLFFFQRSPAHRPLHSFPTRPSSDLLATIEGHGDRSAQVVSLDIEPACPFGGVSDPPRRSEEHTSELQSHLNLVCRLLLEKKKKMKAVNIDYQRELGSNLTAESGVEI